MGIESGHSSLDTGACSEDKRGNTVGQPEAEAQSVGCHSFYSVVPSGERGQLEKVHSTHPWEFSLQPHPGG